MELALKGITKVWGSDAAKAVIKNEAAMKKLIGAGRAAVGAKAIGYGAKQFVKVAAPEIAEEGLQSLSSDLDTRFFGKEKVPVREMMGNALEAMIEAVPSVVGMSIGGAALAGAGAHRAMKRISDLSEMKEAVVEFKREKERSMLQKLLDLRSESSLYKKAPETYRKTLQNQLDHTGSGTLYIDASAAAENEKTHDALNKLVEDGTITAKELDDAIKTGKPLEVETGKYMQTATPETHEALSDYTTMDKGEKTIHAIREERQRMKDMIDIVTMTREKREAAAAEKILNDNFSDDTDIGREDRDTAREILSGGLDHIEDTCKTILQEAKDAWGKLTGVKELQDYMERRKTQGANTSNEKGVDMFDVGEGKDRVHLRVSKNPDWYQDFYGAYGRAPNQRELYDIAQEKIIAENDKGDEESKAAIAEIEEAKKRVESIERVSETLKSLNKEDLIAQTLLDPETYEEAYKPLLEEIKVAGNGAVTKAARDSALILAKLAENFHKNYGVPLKLAMIAAGEVSPETASQLNQSAIENELQLVKEKYWNTEEWMKAPDGTLTKLTERQWLITHSETFREWFGDWETVEKVTKLYYGNPIVMTEGGFKEKLEKAARDNGINIAADADSIRKEIKTIFKSLYPGKELSKGYREPGRVKNLDGELISITVSSAKELRHHSTNPRTLFLAVNLDSVIENATFLYEEVKDESRVKKSNQTTLAYRYYATRVVVNGEECIARIIVRKDKNGNLYFYDGDITSNEQIKKDLPKYLYPDTKTGQNLGKSLFTHSIQEWLAKVKETTDKIRGNGEVLPSVVNDFEESSTYHQMAEEYAHDVLSGKLTKKGMAERQLDADEKSFADSVDRFMAGKISTDTIQVMRTPLVMRLVGAEVLPVEISVSDLKKVLVDKHADITPDIMKQIPRALTDPMMIFSTYSGKNGEARKVIVLELKDENGATIVVPMELEHMSDGYKVNRMTSTYGKTDRKTGEPSYEWFKKQLEAGNLEYVNRKKATDWISTEQPDWLIPKEKVDNLLSAPNVANEEDLVKLKSENPTYYQTAADKDLVVYHNVSAGKLREAIKLVGLLKMASVKVMQENSVPQDQNWQINPDIKGDTVLQVVDLTEAAKERGIITPQQTKAFLRTLVGNFNEETADGKAIIKILKKRIDHVAYSSKIKPTQEVRDVCNNGIFNLKELVNHAVLVESNPNEKVKRDTGLSTAQKRKQRERNAVLSYHRFYVPVRISDTIYTVRLVAEEGRNVITLNPTMLNLYDVIADKEQNKKRREPLPGPPGNGLSLVEDGIAPFDTITIAELLKDVKSHTGEPYFQVAADHSITHGPATGNTGKYQGAYNPTTNVIEIFNGANQSTVVHEGGHMFLTALLNLSRMNDEELREAFTAEYRKHQTSENREKPLGPRDLQDIESQMKASREKVEKDLETIRDWAGFSEEHLAEYKGTALEKEFMQHAEAVRRGDDGAEERWMQERFARGFEKYLMEGSAPTKEMQGVFRRFKKWLIDIYKTTKNLGNVELTPEIKDIFDRMISTEAEINAWAAQRKLEAIDKTVNVNQSELGNLKAWAESVKDKALEKAMSYYLHMVREEAIENFKASISSEEERTSFIESLGEENEIYQIETIYNSDTFPTKKDRDEFLQMAGFTEKDLKEKLRAAGGTTEERWNKHIEEMVQHYREEALTPEAIRGMAEEILRSPEGMAKKSRIEAMLLEKKVSAYIHLVNSMQMELKRSKDKKKTAREIRKRLGLVSEKETTEVDKQTDVIAKSEDKIAKLEKQKKLLKEQLEKAKAEAAAAKGENKSRKESQTILEGNMRALEAELEKERAQRAKADSTTKDAELTAADLAVQLQTMVDGLKESRDAMRFDMREIKEDARNTLGGEKLSHATSWRWWENKAQIAEARAMKAAAGNDWEGAAYWKREQAQCLTMAKLASANEEEIRRTLHGGGGKVTTPLLNENGMERYGILGILNRISRTDKPVMMKDDARYFVQHMAYVLGLTKKDGILPIDESGQERPFNWRWLAVEMNPMQAMDDDRYMAEDIIPGWMRSAFEGSSPMKLKDLTMDQFREMAKVMKAVYKLGRREYEGNTLGTSFDDAAQKIHDEILGNWTHRVATPGLKNQTATNLDRLGTKIHSLIKDITLPEILIERLGKSAAEYFYKPIDKAAAHLRELKSEARVTFRKNFAIYSRKEWTVIRSKKLYTVGLDERGKPVSYTKEQLLAMALNFGTKSNRARLIETLWLSDTLEINEETILDMLDKNLTDKDWDFVESVWEHLNSYWGERNKVQNDLYGTPLGKVQGEDFTLKSGRVIHGAYYRIKYDPLSSTRTSNFSTTDIAKMDMQNISSFSLGMGSTKQRAGTSGGQKLRLDLDVYVEAVNEAMQHIAMREATVDVYKLLNRKEVVTAIENTAGPETLSLLQGWAKDCWHSSIKDMSEWDSALGRARRRFNFATMGFRFSTALLNIGNITGMMERMGAANALKAVGDFYFHGNIVEQRRFIQTKSTMMRDRGATIDRDMYMQDRLPVGKNESEFRSKIEHGKYGVDTLNSKAYWLIQATDEMFSLPEWLFTYKRAMAAMEIEGKLNRDEMDAEAVRLADKAVRKTFGSNETKDQTSFIRKNGILAQMTTFYSYTNLVTNQFIRAGYVLYDKGDIKPLLAATWYWWILGALVETTLREIGDDSDDEDKWKKKFLHVIASGGPIGGVPLAREAVPWTVDFFTGKSFGSAAPDAPFFDTLKHMENFLKATKKGDLIEMGRGATKVVTRTSIPVPDTVTDAFWNFMRMACTDTEFTMWDWFKKSLWDKTLKEKKK